jgi:hypothetical protein
MLKAAMLFVTLTTLHAADARDHLSTPAEFCFRFTLLVGPQITEVEKGAQRAMG